MREEQITWHMVIGMGTFLISGEAEDMPGAPPTATCCVDESLL